MGVLSLFGEAVPLPHAEPVLLVGYYERKVPKLRALTYQGVSPHRHIVLSTRKPALYLRLCLSGHRALKQSHPDSQRSQKSRKRVIMLVGKYLGRRHQTGLAAVQKGEITACRRHCGLTGADISQNQPVHRNIPAHIRKTFLYRSFLSVGQLKRQRGVIAGNRLVTQCISGEAAVFLPH